MKKKRTGRPVGNTLVKDGERSPQEALDELGLNEVVDDDEAARRLKLSEIKNKIASGRYSIPSEEVARSIIKHAAEDAEDDSSES